MSEEVAEGNGPPLGSQLNWPGAGRLPASRGERHLFPLPRLEEPASARGGGRLSRGLRGRHLHIRLVNRAIDALNWLAKATGSPAVGSGGGTDIHSEVTARIDGLVRAQEPVPGAPSPKAAFLELLRGRGTASRTSLTSSSDS